MDVNKFLKSFGLMFVFIGAMIGLGLTVSGIVAKMGTLILIGMCFIALFCGIGGFFALTGINNLKREHVYDHQMNFNDQPTVSLIVRYKENGIIKQAVVRTGLTDTAEFPRGATVTISIHNGEAALIPGSVSDERLPDEENLMNPDFDPENIHSSIGASCPACGANLMVPIGMSVVCPYCGRKVRADKAGNVQ